MKRPPKPNVHPTVQAYLPAVTPPPAPTAPSSPFASPRGPARVDTDATRRAGGGDPDMLPGESVSAYLERVDAHRKANR